MQDKEHGRYKDLRGKEVDHENRVKCSDLAHSGPLSTKIQNLFYSYPKTESLKMFIFLPWNRNLWRMFLFTKTRIFVHSPPFT